MSLVTELSGENDFPVVGGVKYKAQGTISLDFKVRTANGRGSGDATGRPKPIGMTDDAGFSATVISTDRALLALNGTEVTGCDVWSNTTTMVGAFTGFVEAVGKADVAGMFTIDLKVTCLTMPPLFSALDY